MAGRKYAVFIISHKRPRRVKTVRALEKGGYTGDWYVVCDDEDPTLGEYRKQFGRRLLVFSKREAVAKTDTMDNLPPGETDTYARNALWDLADQLGLTHFVVLDDDYSNIGYQMLYGEDRPVYRIKRRVRQLDRLFDLTFDLLDSTGALTVAYAQSGDFLGGERDSFLRRGFKRKAMNAFFFRTDRRMEFIGRLNDDTNTYVFYGMRGELIFSVASVIVDQERTQQQKGGMTETYKALGTYVKSFYTVMLAPSCVRVYAMGIRYRRLHHEIDWEYCVPMIVSSRYRKEGPRVIAGGADDGDGQASTVGAAAR